MHEISSYNVCVFVTLIEGNIYFEKQSEGEFLDVSSVESYGIN